MIRHCDEDDLLWLLETATGFNDRYYGIPLDYSRADQYLYDMLRNPFRVMLRSDTGAIIGVIIEDPFRDWKVLVEIGWYSEGRDGLKLLDAFEEQGRCHKVNEIRMTTLESNKGVEKVLARRGYVPVETSHRLILKD